MKKFILLTLVITILTGVFAPINSFALSEDEQRTEIKKDTKSIFDRIKQLPEDLKQSIIVGAFSLFIYATSFVVQIFHTLLNFVGKFLGHLIDFSDPSFYGQYKNIFQAITNIIYIIAAGFLFVLFVNSVLTYLWKGQDPGKSILNVFFALMLLFAFPYVYKTLLFLFAQISNSIFHILNPSESQLKIFNTLINVNSYLGGGTDDTIIPGFLGGAAAENAILDMDSIMSLVRDKVDTGNINFFVNQIMIFIMSVIGIIALFEVIVLKGAQLLNMALAFFTGIFASVLVASESTRVTYWNWVKKYAQLMSYNIFWGILLLIISVLGAKLATPNAALKILYFVMIFAALKLLSKVGGIAEGLMMSRSVMENFGQAMKMDAALGTYAAYKTLGHSFDFAKQAAQGTAAVGNKGFDLARAAARSFDDPSGNSIKDHLRDIQHERHINNLVDKGSMPRDNQALKNVEVNKLMRETGGAAAGKSNFKRHGES